jgi:hypothetical protein
MPDEALVAARLRMSRGLLIGEAEYSSRPPTAAASHSQANAPRLLAGSPVQQQVKQVSSNKTVPAAASKLLKEISPGVKPVAVLREPAVTGIGQLAAMQTAAPSFEVELQPIDARDVGRFERVLADFAGAPNGGLIVPVSLAFEFVAEGNRLEFDSDSVIDGNDGPCLEYKSRKHRAEFVNGRRIVAVQQHIPTPVTYAYHEQLDLEIAGRLPLREDL